MYSWDRFGDVDVFAHMKYGHQRKYQRGKVDAGKSMKREMPVSNNFRDLAHHVVADQHANELDLRKFGSVMDDTLLDQVARLSVQSGHCCRVLKLGGSNNITTVFERVCSLYYKFMLV